MASFSKYQKTDGTWAWMFKVDLPRDPVTGKRRQTTKRGFKTKKEAQLAAAELEINKQNGKLNMEYQDVLIRDFLVEWLEVYKRNSIKHNTFKLHERNVHKKIIPYCGYVKVKEMSPAFYQKFVNELALEHSKRTVEIIHTTMSNAMNKAVSLDIIEKNPCSKVTIPNQKVNDIKTEDDLQFLTKEEIFHFLDAAYHDDWKYCILLRLLVDTGLRKGEALALQWKDIDFENMKISICKTLNYDQKEMKDMFAPPKTNTSYRSVLISADLLKEIKKQKFKQKERRLIRGEGYLSAANLVFDREDGFPFTKSTLHRAFNRMCQQAGISKQITIHGLRHTHAVMMLESGASLKEVQERLGHKSIQTTADVYALISSVLEQRSMDSYANYMDYASSSEKNNGCGQNVVNGEFHLIFRHKKEAPV